MATVSFPLQVGSGTVKYNLFSKHDNRHAVESCGIHLGGKYGKKHMLDPTINQHFTQDMHTNWGVTTLYNSTYASGYKSHADGTLDHSRCSSAATGCCSHSTAKAKKDLLDKAYIVPTKENFRRFPKRYLLPRDMDTARPSVNATWWSISSQPTSGTDKKKRPQVDATPMSVLGISQQPYPTNNSWKYSYRYQ